MSHSTYPAAMESNAQLLLRLRPHKLLITPVKISRCLREGCHDVSCCVQTIMSVISALYHRATKAPSVSVHAVPIRSRFSVLGSTCKYELQSSISLSFRPTLYLANLFH